MAELVAVTAASHGPLIVRDWNKVTPAHQERLTAGFRALGQRLAAARPDILVVVSPDHWVNFFLDNLPSICIGAGETHQGPPEPFLKAFPHRTLAGAPDFAQHLHATALDNDFEPSVSHHMTLDHGIIIPLWRMELPAMPRLVPLIVNDLQKPMPRVRRCLAWGRLIAQAVASFPGDARVAVLATGGLSHSIGEPTMGQIYEDFDRRALDLFGAGDEAALTAYLEANMDLAGNGAHETRNWAVAHGAAGARGFELIDYLAVPEVYVGCAFGAWSLDAARPAAAATPAMAAAGV